MAQDYAIWMGEDSCSVKIIPDPVYLEKINKKGEFLVAFLPQCPYNTLSKIRESLLAKRSSLGISQLRALYVDKQIKSVEKRSKWKFKI